MNTASSEDDVVWVTEIWRSAADHEGSLSVAGVKELIGQAMPLLSVRPSGSTSSLPVAPDCEGEHLLADADWARRRPHQFCGDDELCDASGLR
ncbi:MULTISPECIES: hypothetical protein [unclassified Streptomyces]|uniref:hypothetical protein n=1 Tax=unclassified Streptomyces TaxID=2593676 RepID=UPI001F200860|nr:hypothetical protein [Streptomyces sp. GS7]